MTSRGLMILLTAAAFMIGAADATAQGIYWIEYTSSDQSGVICRSNIDGSGLQELVALPAGTKAAAGLALDVPVGKMYWTEESAGSIRRADLDGQNVQTVLSGLSHPWGIALDVTNGFLYWTQPNNEGNNDVGIFRAGLDGSSPQEVLDANGMAIALDVPGGKMYFSRMSATTSVYSADLDGSNPAEVVPWAEFMTLFNFNSPFALAVDRPNHALYFITMGLSNPALYDAIGRVNMDGTGLELLLPAGAVPPRPLGLLPFGLALDPENDLMYWNCDDPPSRIYRSTLDATDMTHIYENNVGRSVMALALGPAPTPPENIPALSTWGLLILGMSILAAGTTAARRALAQHRAA